MTVTTPRREATRLRLIEAGIREFGRRGVDATSVEQLCEAAGFSRGAFYSNFSSKDELCLAIHRHVVGQQLQAFGESARELPDGLDVVETVRHLLSARNGDRELDRFILELRLRAQRDPGFERQLAESAQEVLPGFRDVVRAAIERSRVQPLVEMDDLVHILEALFIYRAPGQGEELSTRLLVITAKHLTRPIDD